MAERRESLRRRIYQHQFEHQKAIVDCQTGAMWSHQMKIAGTPALQIPNMNGRREDAPAKFGDCNAPQKKAP